MADSNQTVDDENDRAESTQGTVNQHNEASNKPIWASIVETIVIFLYHTFCLVVWRPFKFMFLREGILDKDLARVDLVLDLAIAINDLLDDFAYPPVHPPEDLDGIDRIVWRIRNKEWWREKAWRCRCWLKRVGRRNPLVIHGPVVDDPNLSAEESTAAFNALVRKYGLAAPG